MKISQLFKSSVVADNMIIPVAEDNTNKSITAAQLKNYCATASNNAWHGTQAQYNALATKDANKMYVISDPFVEDEIVAVYLGSRLLWAVPNMVGEFTADSTVDDWYWYPNGVKTPIPVDPATCKFSYYWEGELKTATKLFVGLDVGANDYLAADCRLKRLERMPKITGVYSQASVYYLLSLPILLEQVPVIDCTRIQMLYYMCVQNTVPLQFERIAFKNTERTTNWEMIFNLNANNKLKMVTGLDASSLITAKEAALSLNGAAYVEITNLGKAANGINFDFRNKNWGDDSKVRHARKSLVDSLLTNSFDRVAAGYSAATVRLSPEAYARLTSTEVSAITAKGFTLVTT